MTAEHARLLAVQTLCHDGVEIILVPDKVIRKRNVYGICNDQVIWRIHRIAPQETTYRLLYIDNDAAWAINWENIACRINTKTGDVLEILCLK